MIFLGGMLLDSQAAMVERDSRIGVQYAADALQRGFIKGLSQIDDVEVSAVNLPFIGSFPRAYRKAWFPTAKDLLFGSVPLVGMGFFNLAIARDVSRAWSARLGLEKCAIADSDCAIVIYSADLPFLRAAIAFRRANPQVRLCLIMPDLIEHMGDYKGIQKLRANYRGRVFRNLTDHVDYYVVLTPHIAAELRIAPDRHAVIEGIHDPSSTDQAPDWSAETGVVFIYTGTLETRYGILDLLQAFARLEHPSARLWICGAGDAEPAVQAMARRDPRVTFHGRVPRARALALQARAHVMVNPRRPEGAFTRYSFPSKTMEYLASGRPVVMHWLPGIPEEYRPYLITPETGDAAGLAAAMHVVAARPTEELRRIGAAGRDFVLREKNPRVQVGKLLAGLFPGWSDAS